MPTEMHKMTVALISQGHTTLDIVRELCSKFDILGDREELEVHMHVNRMRKEMAEYKKIAYEAALEGFRNGGTWREVLEAIEEPCLLTSIDKTSIMVAARDKAAQEAAETTE